MTSRKIILIVAAITIGGMALMGKKVLDNQVFAPTCAAKEVAIPVNPRQIAESITVKVFSANSGGSGTLINKKGQVYTVLTNQHVLTPGEPYRIQTPDGVVYSANAITNVNFGKNDLALLQFRSDADYAVAVLAALETRFLGETGFLGNLAVNQEVFAAGFPFDSTPPLTKGGQGGISFNSGKISLLPDKTLKDGYRIGYTNDIQKGMSGGPILNSQGQVIGINGVHAYPLFGDPYVFEDGSKPSDTQKEQMTRLSWGVPIQIVVQAVPELAATNLVKNVERIAQEITVLITYPNGNGSGVIIAHRDNTYYVLTANHVVRDETQYEVTTPDGRCYPVNYRTVKKFEGVDLAVLEFKSDRSYRVATLGNYDLGNKSWVVFVSGWPGSKVASGKPSRLFTAGFLLSKDRGSFQAKDSDSLTYGYELVYTNITAGGVSGGPVLDTRGRVIGIHGRAEGTFDETGQYPIQLGYSLGISISTFLSFTPQLGMKEALRVETSTALGLTEQELLLTLTNSLFYLEEPKHSASAIDWLNYSNQLWRALVWPEALKAADKAIKMNPNFYQAWFMRGTVLLELQREQEAAESFDKSTRIAPNFAIGWRWRGMAFSRLNRYDEALASFDRGLEGNSEDWNLQSMRGSVLYDLKRYPEAISSFSRAIEIKPNPNVYLIRGGIRSLMEDFQEAIKDFDESLRLKPDYTEAYFGRAFARSNLKDYQGAIGDYSEAIRLKPDFASAYVKRGAVRAVLGNYQEAIKDFNEAIRLTPNDADAYLASGAIHFNLSEKHEAIENYQKAAQLYREQGDMGKYQQAQELLRKIQQ